MIDENSKEYQSGLMVGRLHVSQVRKMMSKSAERQRMFLVRTIKTRLIQNNISAKIINDIIEPLRSEQGLDDVCVKIDKTILNEKENRIDTRCF